MRREETINIILIGDINVGKTSLILQFLKRTKKKLLPTLGV
jgi:GTPase SAR1 family protein